jgi:putative Mg2+ transporter-C (MgtC) family protein
MTTRVTSPMPLAAVAALLAAGPAQAAAPPSVWQEIGQALAQDFADLDDVAQWTRVVTRLLLAALLGGLLGWEREAQGKAAGLRTHMLVCMGAALAVTAMQIKGASVNELARVVEGVITGVGFLGAGTILKRHLHGHESVHGLTTAAGIWLTAAVGISIGVGAEATAIVSALLAFCVLALVPFVAPASKSEGSDAHGTDRPQDGTPK